MSLKCYVLERIDDHKADDEQLDGCQPRYFYALYKVKLIALRGSLKRG